MMERLSEMLRRQSDLVLVFFITAVIFILFTPIPAGLLDFLLISNFSFAFLILLLTFFVKKPLEFSTFPSILLLATLFRLALNIAATRLILADADAGQVIDAVGTHVIGGNYVIGMIVFVVLIVVQYVVVTNGAQRVAEVAARFTLDSMPGKQMAIDADLNIGLIDEKESRRRRSQIEKEGNFYGAMDGASKFVKGDAIAGIIIVLIDIIGGLTIGIAQKGMDWGEALQTYTLLTVGDGIVTQIPALIISTGTGIIVTRAASDSYLSAEISRQITAYPRILMLVAAGIAGLMLLPGIPLMPALVLFLLVAALAWFARRAGPRVDTDDEESATPARTADDELYDMLAVDAIEIRVGQNLIPLVGGEDSQLMDRIRAFRKQYAMEMGFVIPKVRVKDDRKLGPHAYQLLLFAERFGEGEILPDRSLAINPGDARAPLEGATTRDPTYKLPAVWIAEGDRENARSAGYTVVDPLTVLMTHLSEVIRRESSSLLTRGETERLIAGVKARQSSLVDELIPGVMSYSDVQKVLQNLLQEGVAVRNLELILEVLVDEGKQVKDPHALTELVRQRLGSTICQTLADEQGDLHVLVLDPAVERTLATSVQTRQGQSEIVVDPKFAQQLIARMAGQVEHMMKSDRPPVLLCAPELRRFVRGMIKRLMPQLSVISMSEVPGTLQVKSFGMVNV